LTPPFFFASVVLIVGWVVGIALNKKQEREEYAEIADAEVQN